MPWWWYLLSVVISKFLFLPLQAAWNPTVLQWAMSSIDTYKYDVSQVFMKSWHRFYTYLYYCNGLPLPVFLNKPPRSWEALNLLPSIFSLCTTTESRVLHMSSCLKWQQKQKKQLFCFCLWFCISQVTEFCLYACAKWIVRDRVL